MSEFTATVRWRRDDAVFTDSRYSRAHTWEFDGGLTVPASSSPHSVPVPLSEPANVDPEEALVAALSSCHMLFFLALAAKAGYVVESYEDNAVGILERGPNGRRWMSRVTLRPRVRYAGDPPSAEVVARLHHESHDHCYIANSVKSEVVIEEP